MSTGPFKVMTGREIDLFCAHHGQNPLVNQIMAFAFPSDLDAHKVLGKCPKIPAEYHFLITIRQQNLCLQTDQDLPAAKYAASLRERCLHQEDNRQEWVGKFLHNF